MPKVLPSYNELKKLYDNLHSGTKKKGSYNGYSNWATWNLMLYIEQDPTINEAFFLVMKHFWFHPETMFSDECEFDMIRVAEFYKGRGYIMSVLDLSTVNWVEITLRIMQTIRDGKYGSNVLKPDPRVYGDAQEHRKYFDENY